MDENNEYTKRQQKLLNQIQKTDKWQYRTPFIYIVYLVPVMFFVAEWLKWSLIRKKVDTCFAIRYHGKVEPLDIDMNTAILWIIGVISFLLLIMSWMVVSRLRDKRTFKEILDRKDKEAS